LRIRDCASRAGSLTAAHTHRSRWRNLLGTLPSITVIPLVMTAAVEQRPILRLNPQLMIEEEMLIALTQDIAAIPRRLLIHPVANLSAQHDEILAALDFLFTGF